MTNIIPLSELSKGARLALINTTGRMGAVIPQGTPPAVVTELVRYGLIGTCDGLTKAGVIRRGDAMSEALEGL